MNVLKIFARTEGEDVTHAGAIFPARDRNTLNHLAWTAGERFTHAGAILPATGGTTA